MSSTIIRVGSHEAIELQGNAVVCSTLKSTDPDDCCFNAAVDGMESLLLALHCAGVGLEAPGVQEAVRVAYDSIVEHF